MQINHIGEQIGVEVLGADIRQLDDRSFGRIYRAWLDHNVLCVRDQTLEIEELKTFVVQPDAQYRHRWRVGDVVIWDNRCSYHRAAGDYPPAEDRIHWRVSIRGDGAK